MREMPPPSPRSPQRAARLVWLSVPARLPPARAWRRAVARTGGFSLVELMITVAIIGVLAALAIYGVTLYLRTAKSAEAKNAVGAISRAAIAAYEREQAKSEGLPEGDASSASTHALCGSALPVPAAVPKGRKYQPSAAEGADYETGDAENGWRCLKYGMTQATYYQYGYTRDGSPMAPANPGACAADCYEAGARGDIDGDGAESSFALTGHVNVATGQVKTATAIFINDEHE